MALATQCPHCQTTFRVAHDQLKLRAGLVRCGACKEVFNGIEHLLRPDEQKSPAAAVPAPAEVALETPAVAAAVVPVDSPVVAPTVAPTVAATVAATAAPAVTSALAPEAEPVSDDLPSPTELEPASSVFTDSATAPDPVEPTSPIVDTESLAEDTPQDHSAETVDEIEVNEVRKVDPLASIESAALASSLDFDIADPVDRWPLPTIAASIATGPVAHSPVASEFEIDPADPLQRMTLMDFTDRPDDLTPEPDSLPGPASDAIDGPDPLDKAIEDLQRKPWRGEGNVVDDADDPEGSDTDVPAFIRRGQRQQRMGRTLRMAMLSGSLILSTLLAAQGAYVFRNVLAATFPPFKPFLVTACDVLGCTVGLPAQIEAVSIESSELQAMPSNKDAFMLSMLLRNRSNTVQAWPNIELTLNDANDKPIGRRVFLPRDYLAPATDLSKGFSSASEQSIKLNFVLTQLKASGFKVYLFYS